MSRDCAVCGRAYMAKDPRSKYCGAACRQRHVRGTPVRTATPVVGEATELVTVTRKALESVGRLDSVHGQLAMTIAAAVAAGGDTASGLASLSKELRAVMVEALGDGKVVGDAMDELKARRRVKRAG